MDYTPRYSDPHLNSESSTSTQTLYPSDINNIYHQQQQHHCYQHSVNNMNAANQVKTQQRARQKRADLQENMKNSSLGVSYPTKQSVKTDSMKEQPKKEGLWQSMFRSATILGEHLSRDTGSFIKNWTSMTSPLSVTVVSPELYKHLHAPSGEQSMSVDPANVFTNDSWCTQKDSSDETVTSVLYDSDILAGDCKIKAGNYYDFGGANTDRAEIDKRWKEYKCMYVDCNNMQKNPEEVAKMEAVDSRVNMDEIRNVETESIDRVVISDEKELDKSAVFGNTLSYSDKQVALKPMESLDTINKNMQQQAGEERSSTCITPTLDIFKTMCNGANKILPSKVQPRNTSPESEPTAHHSKQIHTSPKPKKELAISRVCGRDTCKSEFRHNGVTQNSHENKHSRDDRQEDIKNNINMEDISNCSDINDAVQSTDSVDFGGGLQSFQRAPHTYDFENIQSTEMKQNQKNFTQSNCEVSIKLSPKKEERKNEDKNKLVHDKNDDDDDEDEEEDEDENEDEDEDEDENEDEDEDEDDEDEDEDEDEDTDDDDDDDDEVCIDEDDDESEDDGIEFINNDSDDDCIEFVDESSDEDVEITHESQTSVCSVESDDSFSIVFNDGNESKTDKDAESEEETENEDKIEAKKPVEDKIEVMEIVEKEPSKIRFNLIPTVHTIIHWKYAYKAARRGPWEEMARDRARFQRRISDVDRILGPIFAVEHRVRIWNQRFANDAATAATSSV